MSDRRRVSDTLAQWLTAPAPQPPNWPHETWPVFQRAAQIHGVAPLLHEVLGASGWLPPQIPAWLARQHEFNSRRIARMQGELGEILALFDRHGLPLMPLKGSILTAHYYPHPGLRPMADLDLLVHPADFEAAAALLVRLGYQRSVTHRKHTEFVKPDNRQVVDAACEHPDNPRKLELHCRCQETFGGPTVTLTNLMWENSVGGTLLGEQAVLPRPEALWLHLLVHHTNHLWQGKARLIQLVDLTRLAPHLNNPLPLLDAVDARFTYPSLALLARHCPAAVESGLLAGQRERVSPRFWSWVEALTLANSSHLNPNPPGLYLFRALRFSEGRPREVAQALRFALLPAPAEIALDHPRLAQSKAPWLAYALLPLDWLRRIGVGSRE
jgi:hypothetical protein